MADVSYDCLRYDLANFVTDRGTYYSEYWLAGLEPEPPAEYVEGLEFCEGTLQSDLARAAWFGRRP